MTKPTNIPPIPIEDHWTYHVKPIMEQIGNKIDQSKPVQEWINDMTKVEDFEEMDEWVEKNLIQLLDLAQWENNHPIKSNIDLKKKDKEEDSTCL